MNKYIYVTVYILLFFSLHVADAVTTINLINMGGVELNPYVNDRGVVSIIFSPPMIIIGAPIISFVIFAEFFVNREKLSKSIEKNGLMILILVLPFYVLIVKVVAIINNILVVAPVFNPFGWIFILFSIFFMVFWWLAVSLPSVYSSYRKIHLS